ncbi:imidazolonepropionase [Sphingoaurantiacus capsulatus]|uniref:Imidazolonepropionase n=1 Tax=Sphingoaurantiacus capsulatus TaxID=1771310 RepID=A0ABV7X8I3_9SPHN
MRFDLLLTDCHAATMQGDAPYGVIENAAIGVAGGRIAWIGAAADLPAHEATETESLGGRWVTPGLIDCHTHLVFGGNRSAEFEARLKGATYQEIAAAGGGILSSVRMTREASEEALIAATSKRLRALKRDGVTTVEIKSGYGLDADTETKMLRAARAAGTSEGVAVVTTYLGLHALPAAYKERPDAYVDHVIDTILPRVAAERLANAVDAYVEPIAFSAEQADRFFAAAEALGLKTKLHAEQFSDSGGAQLAARRQSLSADHLEYVGEEGLAALAKSGTVAVLLPGAFLALRETQLPPIDRLRALGIPMALATDCNPGTSPVTSMLAVLNLACVLFRMTPEEALAGATVNGARALGLTDRGTLAVGQRADLAAWDVERPAELTYWLGAPLLHRSYAGGKALI